MESYRAIFHLDEPAKAPLVFANLGNLLDDLGGSVVVEVVANSEGVKVFLLTGQYTARFREYAEQGVQFAVCANSLRALGFTRDDFPRAVRVVPSGVGEIVRRQAEGYAYIRP
ncbi:DsrE family protein [Methanofollis tationis]|uniref:DsrE family protein n=1 Tax=Methanofollis tationis TaxID=81417 RepID=A0A7K4HQV0_9EURY|nr:DsrE family protein [Methanofollis tationis]NVO67417.1 DsrE family protein [Methanofollis tationis]